MKEAGGAGLCFPLCSIFALLTANGVEITPRAVERRLRLLDGHSVPLMASMREISVAQAIYIKLEGAQSGRPSSALLVRSIAFKNLAESHD